MLSDAQRPHFHDMNAAFQEVIAGYTLRLLPAPTPPLIDEAIEKYNAAGQKLYDAPMTTTGNKIVVEIRDQMLDIEIDDLDWQPGERLYVRIRKCAWEGCRGPFVVLESPEEEKANSQRFCKRRGDKCRDDFKAQRRKEQDIPAAG